MESRLHILLILFVIRQGYQFPESGLLLHLEKQQSVVDTRWVRVGSWHKSSVPGSYFSGIAMNQDRSEFNIQRSGLYIVSINLEIDEASSGTYFLALKSLGSSSPILTSVQEAQDQVTCLGLIGNVQLFLGQQLAIYVKSNRNAPWHINIQSAISLRYVNKNFQVPGFLAFAERGYFIRRDRINTVPRWRSAYNNVGGFSKSTGLFTAIDGGLYFVSLSIVLENLIGVVNIDLRLDGKTILSSSRREDILRKYHSYSLSTVSTIPRGGKIYLSLRSSNDEVTLSPDTAYGCIKIGEVFPTNISNSLRMLTDQTNQLSYPKDSWKKVINWKPAQSIPISWRYRHTAGMMILQEGGSYLFNCKLLLKSSMSTSVTVSFAINGAVYSMGTNYGVSRSLFLAKNQVTTLTVSGVFAGSKDEFVSVYLRSRLLGIITVLSGSDITLNKLRFAYPYASLPLAQQSNISSPTKEWIIATPQYSPLPHWQAQRAMHSYSTQGYVIKKSGIYYITANLLLSNTAGALVEAGLNIITKNSRDEIFMFLNGYSGETNSINFRLPVLLHVDDILQVKFRCLKSSKCQLIMPSSISVVLLLNLHLTVGFLSTLKDPLKLQAVNQRQELKNWDPVSRNGFFRYGTDFDLASGKFKVREDGVYLVTCNMILRDIGKLQSGHYIQVALSSVNDRDNQIKNVKGEYMFQVNSMTLSFSAPLQLKKDDVVWLEVRAAEVAGFTLDSRSTFSIVALPPSQNQMTPIQGFTVSKRSNDIVQPSEKWRSLQDWSKDSLWGSFISNTVSRFDFNRKIGLFVVSQPSLLLVSVEVSVMKTENQPIRVSLRLNRNPIHDILIVTDGKIGAWSTIFSFSCVLSVDSRDSLSIAVDSNQEGASYFVNFESVFSIVILNEVKEDPSMEMALGKYKRISTKWEPLTASWFPSHCEFCYRKAMSLEESSGSYKINFKGVFFISFFMQLLSDKKDKATCEFVTLTSTRGIETGTSQKELLPVDHFTGILRYFNILNLDGSNSLRISCKTQEKGAVTYSQGGFVALAHLPEAQIIKVFQKIDSFAEFTISKEGVYLIQLEANLVGNRTQLLVHSSSKLKLNATEEDFMHGYFLDVVIVVHISKNSNLTFEIKGYDSYFLKNSVKASLYFLGSNLHNGDLTVKSSGYNVCERGSGWSQLHRWELGDVSVSDIGNQYIQKLKEGIFIADKTGQYLISFAVVLSDCKQTKRNVMVVYDGRIDSENNKKFFKSRSPESTVTLSVTMAVRLRRWQTVSLYVHCTENDTMSVERGSSWSFVRLETESVPFEEPGPEFIVHPRPLYINESYSFNWSCDAIGENLMPLHWEWINLYTGRHLKENQGKQIQLKGRPEESGFYYCAAESKGMVAHSDFGILDVSDVDECNATNPNWTFPCHEHANCINTIGSYYCSCKEGFTGNGKTCQDADECTTGLHKCHKDASCNNTFGSYDCTCLPGFSGDGYHCVDINECLHVSTTKCHEHSSCFNYNGSYSCHCLPGFSGNGYTCVDVDECDLDTYPCDDHALCSNSIGSYSCHCDVGWTGNGTTCEDLDECKTYKCTGNATCNNYIGSFRCICNRGYKGDGVTSCEPLGCLPPKYCSGQFKAAWWPRSPYLTNNSNGIPFGLFKDILTQVMVYCCRNCSQLVFSPPLNGSAELERIIESNKTDFGCPLYGVKDQSIFRGFPFMPVVESPGVAFFIKDQPVATSPLFSTLSGSWPILVITFLLACLSGVVIWFLDTVRNPGEFPNSFIEGSWEGFWWAFITMTTVGYGDKAPRSFGARVFGIIWILIGLVIISTFTATITTMLTASSLSDDVKLYGTKVGALDNSEEYRLGVKRNAEVFPYSSVPDIIKGMEDGTVQGSLIDSYVAGEFQSELSSFRLHQILEHVFSYGVVLARDGLALKQCFKLFLETKQSEIYGTISKVVRPLKAGKQDSSAVEKSSSLFDFSSPFFRYAVYGGFGILSFLLIIGFSWEFFYWRPKLRRSSIAGRRENAHGEYEWQNGDVMQYQKNIFTSELNDLRNQIRKFADLWISKLDDMERRHKDEVNRVQKWISKRGFVRTLSSLSGFSKETDNRNGTKRSSLVKLSTFDASEHV